MSEELTKAVQQALAEKFEAMHANGDAWITTIAAAKLCRALTQRPAARTEREACSDCDGKGYTDSWTVDGEYNPTHCESCDGGRKPAPEPDVARLVASTAAQPAQADERAAFEVEMRRYGWNSTFFTRSNDGCYLSNRATYAFIGWQARASLPTHPAAQATLDDEELPGMWSASDLIGGETDAQQATPEPVGEPFAWTSMGQIRFTPPTQDHDTYTPLYTHPTPGVPEGFALVPVEPTPEMIRCAEMWDDGFEGAYARALAAAQAKGGAA